MFNTLNLIDTEILLVPEQLNKACHQQASETHLKNEKKYWKDKGERKQEKIGT